MSGPVEFAAGMRAWALFLLGLADAGAAAPAPEPVVRIAGNSQPDATAREAFRVAFGRSNRAVVRREGRTLDFRPLSSIDLGGGRIALLSTGTVRDAGHAEDGVNAIHYLARQRGRLRVTGRWFGLGAGGSDGAAISRWGMSRRISRWPVWYTEGGGTFQGCTNSLAVFTELRPDGPVDIADFQVGYSDAGTGWGERAQEIDGIVTSAVPGREFTISYSGTTRFRETYIRHGNTFRLTAGESNMPSC